MAENSGGVRCLKYGLTGHNLLGLRFVCADGEIAEIGHQAGECAGYDLLPILTGSEGLLGISTEITLRLRPRPAAARVALAAFASARAAGDAVSQIVAAGIVPSGLEMMDQGAVRAVEEFVGAGYPQDAAAILLFEVDGGEDEVAREMARGESIARAAGAIEFRIAKDEAERELFWRGRKAAFPAAGRIKSDYYCMDGTIPRRRLGETLEKIAALARRQIARLRQCFSRRRRQFASAHLLRRRERRRNAARARNGRRDYALVRRGGRQHHRRARSRSRKTGRHVRAIYGRRVVDVSRFENGFRRIRLVESRQGGADFESLRPSSDLCAAAAAEAATICRGFSAARQMAATIAATMAAAGGDFDSQTADVARAIREAAARGRGLCFEGGGSQAFLRRAAAPRLRYFAVADGGRHRRLRAVGIVYLRARGDAAFGDRKNARRQRANARFRSRPLSARGRLWAGRLRADFRARAASPPARRAISRWARALSTGAGARLSFGGRVIKNVAGFDVSRLLVGSFGTLGVIIEATLRVSPAPEAEATLHFEKPDPDDALDFLRRALAAGLPISADAWRGGRLALRLAGAQTAVAGARKKLGGEEAADGGAFWRSIREHEDSFFASAIGRDLWRVVLPPLCPAADFAAGLDRMGGAAKMAAFSRRASRFSISPPRAAVLRLCSAPPIRPRAGVSRRCRRRSRVCSGALRRLSIRRGF